MAIPILQMFPSGIKATKLYSQLPTDGSGDFTVSNPTASGIRSYVDSNGIIKYAEPNVPRIDFTDGGCGVLLNEPQSTNLMTWSEVFNSWTKLFVTVNSDVISSPSGIVNADALMETIDNNVHRVQSVLITPISGQDYTFVIYAKSGLGRDFINIQIDMGGFNSQSFFDISNGVLGVTLGGGGAVSTIELVNGWYKCSVVRATSSATVGFVRLHVANTDGNSVYIGDITKGLYIWGAKLAPDDSSYIPTQGTTVTRLADVVTVAPPVGVTEIIETIDNVDQPPITVIPPTYTAPFGNINKIIMN